MFTKALQFILGFLALLQSTVHRSVSPDAQTDCTARAWVRAPDLTPDAIIRGDARVKISAGCPAVEAVSLGLRLKERSLVKALRSQEDRKWMYSARSPPRVNYQPASPWALPTSRFPDPRDDIRFQEMLLNKDLWFVREEERIVFETRQAIDMAEADRDVVQDFVVLVPSTNFPPALDKVRSGFVSRGDVEIADAEYMYEYFVRIPFANGTTQEIPAGFTGFQPLYDPTNAPRRPSPETVGLKQMRTGSPRKNSAVTSYTAEISGLVFTQGSKDQVATVVITRTGPARAFTAPLTIRGCVEPSISSKWAVEHGMPCPHPIHRPGYVLRSTLEDVRDAESKPWKPPCADRNGGVTFTMPNSTAEEILLGDVVTTTSEVISVPVKVNRRQMTDFEAYYQVLSNTLQITLEIPRAEDGTVDTDEPSAWSPDIPDDEEPWVPWEGRTAPKAPCARSGSAYSGRVPAAVRPAGEVTPSQRRLRPGVDGLGQTVLSSETICERRPLTHYLNEGARGPVFVDYNAVHALLAEDPAERQLRAPILQPVLSSAPEGEELVYHYYHHPGRPLIYVGETWAKKVANQDGHKVNSATSGPSPIAEQRFECDAPH